MNQLGTLDPRGDKQSPLLYPTPGPQGHAITEPQQFAASLWHVFSFFTHSVFIHCELLKPLGTSLWCVLSLPWGLSAANSPALFHLHSILSDSYVKGWMVSGPGGWDGCV